MKIRIAGGKNALVPGLGMVMLVALLLAGPARSYAQPASANLISVANAFVAAYNADDVATVRSLVDPAFQFISDPGTARAQSATLAEFMTPPLVHVTVNNAQQTGPNTVDADLILSEGGIPALPHPYLVHNTLTFSNGKLQRILQVTSAQTAQDLAALGPQAGEQPGMPTTGTPDTLLPALLGVGLLLVAAGALARRAVQPKG